MKCLLLAPARNVALSLLLALSASSFACSGTDEGSGGDGDGDDGRIPVPNTGGTSGSNGGNPGTGASSPGTGGGMVGTGGANGSGTGGGPAMLGPSHVVIVAHQDDDLLFVNPELQRAIDRGDALTTTYVTSGDAGLGMTYVQEREAGIKSAYSSMAGEMNSWTCGTGVYAGKTINECTLNGEKDVKLVFFRLVDGGGLGTLPGSVLNLWQGSAASSEAVDGSGLSFTREELVNSLADVLAQRGATHLHTTDFSFQHANNDHRDHEYSALFAQAASGAYSGVHQLSSYITYSTGSMTENLSAEDTATVSDTFALYASCDSEIMGCTGGPGCDTGMCSTTAMNYISWFSRLYSFSRRPAPATGTLSSSAGTCLVATGTQATTGSCSGATSWTWSVDYTLQSPDGMCLTAGALGASKTLSMSACTGSDHQRWFVMDNGQVSLATVPAASDLGGYAITQCLDGTSATAVVADCDGSSGQSWTL